MSFLLGEVVVFLGCRGSLRQLHLPLSNFFFFAESTRLGRRQGLLRRVVALVLNSGIGNRGARIGHLVFLLARVEPISVGPSNRRPLLLINLGALAHEVVHLLILDEGLHPLTHVRHLQDLRS